MRPRPRTVILGDMRRDIETDRGTPPASASSPRHRELEEVVLELRNLVEVRMLLESRDAPTTEVALHNLEIDRLRTRLARLVKEDVDDLSSAA